MIVQVMTPSTCFLTFAAISQYMCDMIKWLQNYI